MRISMKSAGIALGCAVLGLAVLVQQVSAAQAPFPRFSRFYITWFARAMDPCSPTSVSVVTPGLPAGGCLQANAATDSSITMNFARLIVNRRGRLALLGVGLPFGARVKVELKLRVTKANLQVKHPPGSNKRVTFQDITIQCPPTPFGFVAGPRGTIAQATTLANCLGTSASDLASPTSNIEVLDSALINVDTGLVFARPGVVR